MAASQFEDVDAFFKIKPLRLPIRGKTYVFPGSVSGRTGLLLHRMTDVVDRARQGKNPREDADTQILDDEEETDLRAEILGDTEAEMIADNVPSVYIEHAFRTLIGWHQFGEEVALALWKDVPGAPKAPADRKAKRRPATSGKATSTKSRASTTPTSASIPASDGDGSSSTGA